MRVYLWSVCVCVCVCVCIERPAAADWGGWEARGKMKCHKQTHIWNMYLPYVLSRYTGWPRLIGSRKLHIIIHKRATKYTSLLRKMTYKDKGSYESSPPCIRVYVLPLTHSSTLHPNTKPTHTPHHNMTRVYLFHPMPHLASNWPT